MNTCTHKSTQEICILLFNNVHGPCNTSYSLFVYRHSVHIDENDDNDKDDDDDDVVHNDYSNNHNNDGADDDTERPNTQLLESFCCASN